MSTIITKHLTENELAKRWGVSVKTIQTHRQKGGGPPFMKLGGLVRYRLDAIEAYENASTRASTAHPEAA